MAMFSIVKKRILNFLDDLKSFIIGSRDLLYGTAKYLKRKMYMLYKR